MLIAWVIERRLQNMMTLQTNNITLKDIGSIHDWGTTFGIKELRTMSHWISAFNTI